jgi:hypothetical protein
MTSHTKFKQWVKAAVLEDRADAVELCSRVFPCHPDHPEVLDTLADYLNLLARLFLDADSYNAAKHGMAFRGASEQWSVALDEVELLGRSGATVSWLARWPRDDSERPARWTEASRSFSVEACVALIYSASLLMRGLWLLARHRWLGAELTESVRPWPPYELFARFDLQHPVIADFFRPLRYEGEKERTIVRSRNLRLPEDP